jgi:hypothetical protein
VNDTRIPRIKFGIQKLDDALAVWAQRLESALNVSGVGPVKVTKSKNGQVIELNLAQTTTAKITANLGSGSYTAVEYFDSTTGGFTLLPGGRTLTIYEFNGNASVPTGTYVDVKLYPSAGEWRFQAASCS